MRTPGRRAQLGQGLVVAITAVAQDGGGLSQSRLQQVRERGTWVKRRAKVAHGVRNEEWRDLQGRDPGEALREILATDEEEVLEDGAAAT